VRTVYREDCKLNDEDESQNMFVSLKMYVFKLVLKFCFELSVATNITTNETTVSLPTPDEPLLLSSGYFTFKLDWSSYQSKYNTSPVVYVLEVTRHENITDPFVILPLIQKYHTVIYFILN